MYSGINLLQSYSPWLDNEGLGGVSESSGDEWYRL